ncbi:MAG: hypothetical protein NTU51_02480 [Bacteroidetes bacterium]|nr:hypothetical protein [Bacteroidota bacterium]
MIDEDSRKAIASLISRKAGLNFPASHWGDLDRGIRNTSEALKIGNTKLFLNRLLDKDCDPGYFEILINNLTIGETYFFREKPLLDVFTNKLIPELTSRCRQGNKILNIWSAGCCSGEEAYTIAMLLNESLPDIAEWKIKILASDVNKTFLKKAETGKYSAWSFRETPPELRKKYFTSEGNSFIIRPEIKKMVRFFQLNLMDGDLSVHGIFKGQMNVIFCRNVIMYFTTESIRKTYALFANALQEGGWLITSPVELPPSPPRFFNLVKIGQAMLLQKSDKPEQTDQEFILPVQHNYQPPLAAKSVLPDSKPADHKIPDREIRINKAKPRRNDSVALAKRAFQKRSYAEVIRLLEHEKDTLISTDALVLLIKAYANTGHLQEAESLCIRLLEFNSDNPLNYYFHASILLELGQEKQAEEALRKALYLDPEMVLSHFLMGNLMRRKGELKLAGKHFRNVLKIVKDLADDTDLPESDGIKAGYIRETVKSLIQQSL